MYLLANRLRFSSGLWYIKNKYWMMLVHTWLLLCITSSGWRVKIFVIVFKTLSISSMFGDFCSLYSFLVRAILYLSSIGMTLNLYYFCWAPGPLPISYSIFVFSYANSLTSRLCITYWSCILYRSFSITSISRSCISRLAFLSCILTYLSKLCSSYTRPLMFNFLLRSSM